MNVVFGLLIIAFGSFGQSSSYVPIKKIKDWSWECFWLIQGVFAWLLFPYIGAVLSLPEGIGLGMVYSTADNAMLRCIGYGALWGIGGLSFGLSMRYLGVALGQSLALGTCSALGTLIPALLKGENLFRGDGLILLISVCIAIAGIAVISYAGSLRSKNMSEEEKKKAVKDFALKKGVLIALLSGVMSACFSLGLDAGTSIKSNALSLGVRDLFALNPVILLVTFGGFVINACFCLFQNYKNKTFGQYFSVPKSALINNLAFCALAGLLWYCQFFGLGMGQSFLEEGSVMMAFSWSILMSLNVAFSNLWGIILKEWVGAGSKTIMVLLIGLSILIISILFPQLMI